MSVCPHCGYCPHCGRSNRGWYPTYPYWWSQPIYAGGGGSIGGAINVQVSSDLSEVMGGDRGACCSQTVEPDSCCHGR